MDRPRRESRQHDGITLRDLSQLTFATKSAKSRHWLIPADSHLDLAVLVPSSQIVIRGANSNK